MFEFEEKHQNLEKSQEQRDKQVNKSTDYESLGEVRSMEDIGDLRDIAENIPENSFAPEKLDTPIR